MEICQGVAADGTTGELPQDCRVYGRTGVSHPMEPTGTPQTSSGAGHRYLEPFRLLVWRLTTVGPKNKLPSPSHGMLVWFPKSQAGLLVHTSMEKILLGPGTKMLTIPGQGSLLGTVPFTRGFWLCLGSRPYRTRGARARVRGRKKTSSRRGRRRPPGGTGRPQKLVVP